MEQRVKGIMAKVFKIDEIPDDSSMDTIENWDSLRHMYFVVALEEEFGVEFSQTQITEMLSYKIILLTLQEVAAG